MIKFSKIQESEIELIRKWRNAQLEVLRQASPIDPENQLRYFQEQVWSEEQKEKPKQILRSIYDENLMIGYGGLTNISWHNRRAEVSFLLNPDYTKQKRIFKIYFAEFLEIVCRLAFDTLLLNRLCTETYSFRSDIIKTMELNGFVLEGIMRNHVLINDKFVDSLIHGKLRGS